MFPPLISPVPSPVSPPGSSGFPLSPAARWLCLGLSLLLLLVFGVARGLEPLPRGYGTHQQLGLPPCTSRTLWNLPCPACGMTTSFANLTRGRLAAAARANVSAVPLALTCLASIPWLWVSAWQGRCWKIDDPVLTLFWLLLSLMGLAIFEWALRLSFV